jgi:uncharacterized protein YyaL (SSP411 family)
VTEGVKMLKMFLVEETSIASITDLNSIFKWEPQIDDKGGGHSAPKFPMPANWEYLLQYHHH